MEYTQRFTLKQERMKHNYPIVWTLICGFYWGLTLAYPNSLGTKRLCYCGRLVVWKCKFRQQLKTTDILNLKILVSHNY
jgi:hypothetical protein